MKRFITIAVVALLSVLSSGMVQATFEFRSPLSVRRGVMHWPLVPSHNAWWYDMMPDDAKNSKWNIHTWSASYYRCANKTFFDPCDNKNTRKTAELSTLWFGKDSFIGEEMLVGGNVVRAGATEAQRGEDLTTLNRNNIFLGSARITPRFDYNEQGAFFGVHVDRRFGNEEKWHAGGKVNVPFKVIEIEQNSNCKLEETLDDLVKMRQINVDVNADPDNLEYAARFDFLNTLVFNTGTADPANNLVVKYENNGQISVFGEVVDGSSSAEKAGDNNVPAAYVTKNDDGNFPSQPFGKTSTQASTQLVVDGSGVNGGTFFFKTDVPYRNDLRNDREAQGKLFLVPRVNDAGAFEGNADNISDNLFNFLDLNFKTAEPVSRFFCDRDINLCAHERIVAVGDIEAEVYCGYGHRTDWFVDGILGFRLPTGKKNKDPKRLFFQSTGHNRHFEVKLGLEGGWMPIDWFSFKLDASFHHAFRRTEKRATLFKGATVRHIGETIDARVSWSYFIIHGDLNFFHPHNPDLGCVVGYELFAKRNDNVRFKDCKTTTTATDLLGRTDQELDAKAYEKRTNSMSHKFRFETFHRWNLFEIFAGGSHIVAGRNVMKETEGHVGFAVYF